LTSPTPPEGVDVVEKFKSWPFGMQLGVTLAIMVVILWAGWTQYPGIGKQRVTIKEQQAKLDDLNAEIQKGVNLEKKLPELEREISNLEQQLEQLKTIMPPARIDSEIVAKLESLAKRSRLLIKQLSPGRPHKKDFYDEYPISIELSANYHDLAKFFDRMAQLPRIFNVSGVTLHRSAANTAGAASQYSIDASFQAMTFIYRETPPAPAATTTTAAKVP
jgi:type IV pilus assembly protein PilO